MSWRGWVIMACSFILSSQALACGDGLTSPHKQKVCANAELSREWEKLSLFSATKSVPMEAWLSQIPPERPISKSLIKRRLLWLDHFGQPKGATPSDHWSGFSVSKSFPSHRLVEVFWGPKDQVAVLITHSRQTHSAAFLNARDGQELLSREQAILLHKGGSARATLLAQLGLKSLGSGVDQLPLDRRLEVLAARHGGSHCFTPLQHSLRLVENLNVISGMYVIKPLGQIQEFRSEPRRCAIAPKGNVVASDYQSLEPKIWGKLNDDSFLVSYDNDHLIRFKSDLTTDYFQPGQELIAINFDELGVLEDDYAAEWDAADQFFNLAALLVRQKWITAGRVAKP